MESKMASMDKPFIPDFYKEKDIFITGATGFMGKVSKHLQWSIVKT